MSATIIKVGDRYDSSAHMEYQLSTQGDVANLPGTNKCAIGSIAYLQDLSIIWILGQDNVWHKV